MDQKAEMPYALPGKQLKLYWGCIILFSFITSERIFYNQFYGPGSGFCPEPLPEAVDSDDAMSLCKAILFRPQCDSPSGVETRIFQDN